MKNRVEAGPYAAILKFAGYLLSVFSIFFIADIMLSQKGAFEIFASAKFLVLLVVGAAVYLICNLLLAFAWGEMLHSLNPSPVSVWRAVGIYGRTQIFKYIPGNLFSLSGRYLMSLRLNVGHEALIGASTFEFLGLAAVSGIMAVLAGYDGITGKFIKALLIAFAVLLFIFLFLGFSRKWIDIKKLLENKAFRKFLTRGVISQAIRSLFLYILFFALAGFVFSVTVALLEVGLHRIPLAILFFTYAASWFAGFITPGAPAGVGVREGMMVLILSGYIGEPSSVAAAVFMRAITIVGDVLFFLLGWIISPDRALSALEK
jgi:uncharacterized membrane protein YbhN (UPF0104 family)